MILKCAAGAFALSLMLAVSSGAAAQTPPPESVRLGSQLSEELLRALDFDAVISQEMTKSFTGESAAMLAAQPQWRDLFIEAMKEEMDADHAVVVVALGRQFAQHFTPQELKIGIALFGDADMVRIIRARSAGQAAPADVKPPPALQKALESPDGKAFAVKFAGIAQVMQGAQAEFARILVPGFFRRFGEKASVVEKQRRVQEGLPAGGL